MMRFLIDGHRDRVSARMTQWPEGVVGQLLTRYRRGHDVYAIDNGAFTAFNEREFRNLLRRNATHREHALFVCIPDKVGCHSTTLKLYEDFNHLADGWRKAFVAQDGFDGAPDSAQAIFIGGTDKFKDSDEALELVSTSAASGLHVHVGRVNGPERFLRFYKSGAHTCDGSGVSRYDYMLPAIKQAVERM